MTKASQSQASAKASSRQPLETDRRNGEVILMFYKRGGHPVLCRWDARESQFVASGSEFTIVLDKMASWAPVPD